MPSTHRSLLHHSLNQVHVVKRRDVDGHIEAWLSWQPRGHEDCLPRDSGQLGQPGGQHFSSNW